MNMDNKNSGSSDSASTGGEWIQSLAKIIRVTDGRGESSLRTVVSFDANEEQPSLFVPPDMATLQPHTLRYLRTFARQHAFKLIEDRRQVEIQPIVEQREQSEPQIALGLGKLLKQTGMPGQIRTLSQPHRLNPDSVHISIQRLINMVAKVSSDCKKVVVLPNSLIVDVLDNNTQPIAASACKIQTDEQSSILSHFDSPTFRAIGYSAGGQYIMHVFLAGGPLRNPQLWAPQKTLAHTDFRFQLYPGTKPEYDFGLFYSTFYFDVTAQPTPWWLKEQAVEGLDTHNNAAFLHSTPPPQQSAQ